MLGNHRFSLPVTVSVMARSEYILAGPGNPVSEQASPREITFGIVADDDEASLARLIMDRYMQHPQRRAGLTGWPTVARLIDSLQGLCNSQVTIFIKIGEMLARYFGNVPGLMAAQIIHESERIASGYRCCTERMTLARRCARL